MQAEKKSRPPKNCQNRQENVDRIEKAIIDLLLVDPKSTRKQLSAILNVGEKTIRYRLEKLQRESRYIVKARLKPAEWVVKQK
ncbi:MAG: winged helix-turn-helix transcriptional regulator [Ruminococcus sp.]|nr:winged helix-turn-helix transcriptional regulator [Ruminococcus sp.]